MPNSKSQAGTEAQQSTEAEVTTSSSHNAKPNVIGSFISLEINRENTGLISTNEKTAYVIGIGNTDYTIHRDAEDIHKMYFDESGFFRNFEIKDFHSYHVFEARVRSICGSIKFKESFNYKGKSIKIKKAYIGIQGVTELINNDGGRRRSDYLTFNGLVMSKINERLMYVIEVA